MPYTFFVCFVLIILNSFLFFFFPKRTSFLIEGDKDVSCVDILTLYLAYFLFIFLLPLTCYKLCRIPEHLSASSKRKKGQKNKKSNQRRSMGELLVLPFLSKFPIPSASNLSQKKILNE